MFADGGGEVCGKTRGKRHRETWWWNDEVAEFVKEKRRLFRIYDRLKRGSGKWTTEENKRRYDEGTGGRAEEVWCKACADAW